MPSFEILLGVLTLALLGFAGWVFKVGNEVQTPGPRYAVVGLIFSGWFATLTAFIQDRQVDAAVERAEDLSQQLSAVEDSLQSTRRTLALARKEPHESMAAPGRNRISDTTLDVPPGSAAALHEDSRWADTVIFFGREDRGRLRIRVDTAGLWLSFDSLVNRLRLKSD